jgi:hypothetical protein
MVAITSGAQLPLESFSSSIILKAQPQKLFAVSTAKKLPCLKQDYKYLNVRL